MKLFGAGGFIGSMIALAAVGLSYVQIRLEENRARTAIMAELLRDDPAQTAHLIIQAHDMGVVTLTPEQESKALAVIDREMRAVVSEAAEAAPLSTQPPSSPAASPQALAFALDSPDWDTRVRAAQAVSANRREDPAVTESMIALLENRAVDALSASGLHTLILLLDRQAPASWNDALRERCVDVLDKIEAERPLSKTTKQIAEPLRARLAQALTRPA
jgi:hypothetical protein